MNEQIFTLIYGENKKKIFFSITVHDKVKERERVKTDRQTGGVCAYFYPQNFRGNFLFNKQKKVFNLIHLARQNSNCFSRYPFSFLVSFSRELFQLELMIMAELVVVVVQKVIVTRFFH